MPETIDFTQMRLGTKTRGSRKIKKCPRCGRKGERVDYRQGGANILHKTEINGWLSRALDSCYLTKAEVAGENL